MIRKYYFNYRKGRSTSKTHNMSRSNTAYIPAEIFLTDGQQEKFANAVKMKKPCTIDVEAAKIGNSKVYLTNTQLEKLREAKKKQKSVRLKFSKKQVSH